MAEHRRADRKRSRHTNHFFRRFFCTSVSHAQVMPIATTATWAHAGTHRDRNRGTHTQTYKKKHIRRSTSAESHRERDAGTHIQRDIDRDSEAYIHRDKDKEMEINRGRGTVAETPM